MKEQQEYVFRVIAVNIVGQSDALVSKAVTPKHPFGPPSAPEGPLEYDDLTSVSVTLTWKPPKSDGGKPLTGYIIERRDAKRSSWVSVETVKPNITTYIVQNLVVGNDYYFRIKAENVEGVSPALEGTKAVRPFKVAGK